MQYESERGSANLENARVENTVTNKSKDSAFRSQVNWQIAGRNEMHPRHFTVFDLKSLKRNCKLFDAVWEVASWNLN